MSAAQTVPLTFIVLTRDEEKNLVSCLESVYGWVKEIVLVDSGSTDSTLEIAERFGARIVSHPFESHAKQWNWALHNLGITTDWVLGLDADQRVTQELQKELIEFLSGSEGSDKDTVGCFIKRRQVFRGKWIRHGGYYPKYLLKMFRLSNVRVDEGDLVDHHFRVDGKTVKFGHDIIEDNKNEADISVWIAKHNRYAALQAIEENRNSLSSDNSDARASFWGTPDERVLWQKNLWRHLPLYARPFIYFGQRYFFRLGFLDGKEGFIFHFLQAFWYRLLVDIKLDELRNNQATDVEKTESRPAEVKRISNKA